MSFIEEEKIKLVAKFMQNPTPFIWMGIGDYYETCWEASPNGEMYHVMDWHDLAEALNAKDWTDDQREDFHDHIEEAYVKFYKKHCTFWRDYPSKILKVMREANEQQKSKSTEKDG